MEHTKKLVSMLLCFVMLLGLFPAGVLRAEAAGNTTYVLAGGDFQEAGDHANSAANVTNILKQVSKKYAAMDGFLFIGDYDCETHDSASETASGINALMGAVQGSYANLNDENSVLVQGNHDYKDSRIDATGGHEFDGYAAYVLNEDDYPNGGGSQSGIQTMANNLKTWLNNKIGEGYSAPIFVVSHLPLAFTPRTVTQGDAKYAKYIFDVLNEAGADGLNIIFLHGHDHAYGPDNYMGGEAIYLPVGDQICIAEAGSTSKWTEETLNFTYMNAGYVGYYSDPYTYVTTAGTKKLTMTVFAITGSEVTVERYSEDGLYNLKSAGYDGSYSNTSVTNKTLGLPTYSTVYASPQTIALAASDMPDDSNGADTIGSWVGVTPDVADDVTTSGSEWTTITEPVAGSTTYKYTQATSITAGEEYVIVGNNNAVALMDNNGSMGIQNVTISGSTMTSTTELNEWTFSGRTSGTIYNGTRYLRYNNNSFSLNRNSSTTFTITDNGSNFRIQSGNYSFYYNGSSWTSSARNTAQYVRLYQLTDTTITGGTDGLYAHLDGELTYNVEVGTSAEDALAAVMEGIAIKYATAADYSDETEYADDGEGMTWTLDPNYKGNVPGDYAVTIAYNGVTLGTAEVVIPATTIYYALEGSDLYTVDMGTSADDALDVVKDGITVFSATDANGSDKTEISDGEVTWNWVDKYDGSDSGPYTVEIRKDGTRLGTVEVKVDVKYETGIEEGWIDAGSTGAQYRYVLDTNGIDYGSNNKYLIVGYLSGVTDGSYDYALTANGSNTGVVQIDISGNTATVDTRDYEWYFATGLTNTGSNTYNTFITQNGSTWLYHTDSSMFVGNGSNAHRGYWSASHRGNGVYRFGDQDGAVWYLRYSKSGNKFTVKDSTSSNDVDVRLYKYDSTIAGGKTYVKIEGPTVYTVTQGSSATSAMSKVKAGITAYISSNANGSNSTELADSKLTWKWKNTFNGNSTGSYWVEISYQGKVLGTVEVRVEPGVVNNYPEYPNEGAVKVNKTSTGVDFQSTGIAQVEVSASGVPIKKGADVIVMLDTSSSMTSHTVTGSSKTRAQVLEESLKNLIAQFKTPGADGELLDLRVAIADFNGFYSSGPYARDGADTMSDGISYSATSEAQIYTGDRTLGAGAFIPAGELANSYTLNYTSGTNYDYAFDAVYQMGTAIKEANGSEERDLYVIFMSDGAAMQWNYYHSQGASSLWNNWITGAWTANQLSLNCNTHAYYYDEVDHNGDGMRNEHRMANAIKGDPSETYEVIRKQSGLGTPTGEANMYMVPGLGAKLFSISFDATADDKVTEESMDKSIASLASEQTGTTQYYYKVTTAAQLNDAFDAIGSEIAYAAYNARFVDQMGRDYDLQMKTVTYSVVNGTSTTSKTLSPKIEIISYDIYTKAEADAGQIPSGKNIGDRKGTYTILETVTFNADGTAAYSDKLSGNILRNGVIYAQSFWYNTNATGVAIDGVSIPTGVKADGTTTGSTNVLPAETFYWKMGTVQTSELAMRYHVYLEGSMEGTREGDSYPTNEYANLYFDNYLGNPCYKDTVSPVMPWKEANVSYAFYLVNEKGEIIVNQTTGQTGSFANKIAITNPVVHSTLTLNSGTNVDASVLAEEVLPSYYNLYDSGAKYTITINSNSTGKWEIEQDKTPATTYVTQFDPKDPTAYSTVTNMDAVGNDYTHTVVWFAVVFTIQAHPDAVVIDYGLPVDISVLTNDMFGENGKLAGVGKYSDSLNLDGHTANLVSGFGGTYTGTYGTAKTDNTTGKVRYTPKNMQMDGYEKFAYAVNYTGSENAGYYYDTVTVIPATTIYYEDSFLTFNKFKADDTSDGTWGYEGSVVEGATQAEDRPGQYSLTDANNIYGYDDVNGGMSKFSLGQARKVHVDKNSYATAEFTFAGTGFDVISMTSNTTGVISVEVKNSKGDPVVKKIVNTYYGYNYDAENGWVAAPDQANALYQVPVLQVEGLDYGTYSVKITATYMSAMDKTTEGGYDLYLDAIRVYDPANDGKVDDDTTIEDAYKADREGWPSYLELRNHLIEAETFGSETGNVEGMVFIDGMSEVGSAQIQDYISYGPNNEVYLAPGQSVAFQLKTSTILEQLHLGVKSANGSAVTYTIKNIASAENSEDDVKPGTSYNEKTYTVDTTTDMYYDLTGWKNDIIVITNVGTSGIVSLTNIKSTYSEEPAVGEVTPVADTQKTDLKRVSTMGIHDKSDAAVLSTSLGDALKKLGSDAISSMVKTTFETEIYMTSSAARLVLADLNSAAEPELPAPTDPTEPTEPAPTDPEPTEPAPTDPEPTEPEQPETFEPDLFHVKLNKDSVKVGQKVLVTVTTSADVDHVIVNGTVVTSYSNGSSGRRAWKLMVTAEEPGTMMIEVRCCDDANAVSHPIREYVSVEQKNLWDHIVDLFT